ncbi:MAG TPA: hypothetical protein VF782_15390, partial [Allosphingosinicella sp.]
MFSSLCHIPILPESAWIQPAKAGTLLRSVSGALQHGRREVIRERLSSRHCEEPKNADGPPDGVAGLARAGR